MCRDGQARCDEVERERDEEGSINTGQPKQASELGPCACEGSLIESSYDCAGSELKKTRPQSRKQVSWSVFLEIVLLFSYREAQISFP